MAQASLSTGSRSHLLPQRFVAPVHKLVRGSLAGFLAALLLAACSSGVTVRSDASPTADFTHYKTYGFFQPMGIEEGYNSPIYGQLFRAAISQQMDARGYTLAKDPDLLINVTSRFDSKVRVTTYTAPYMMGGYYGRYYGPGVGMGTESRATVTQDVSAFIDLVDNAGDRIAWQGVGVVTLSDKKAQELKQTIDFTVSKVFGLYPHKAGQ
jgi:hypothetical protein